MKTTHDVWKCELCRHIWLAFDNEPPSQCAKCRKRGWNASGIDRTIEPPTPKTQASELPNTPFLDTKPAQPVRLELKSRLEPENISNEDVEPERVIDTSWDYAQ